MYFIFLISVQWGFYFFDLILTNRICTTYSKIPLFFLFSFFSFYISDIISLNNHPIALKLEHSINMTISYILVLFVTAVSIIGFQDNLAFIYCSTLMVVPPFIIKKIITSLDTALSQPQVTIKGFFRLG